MVRKTRKAQTSKKRGGNPNSMWESRKQSTTRRKIAWGPTETREFHRSPTEQEIDEADLRNKIDYYTEKLASAKSSNASLQTELDGMKTTGLTTLNTKITQLSKEYANNRNDNGDVAQHTRQALLKTRAQKTDLEEAILEIESEIAANNYKIARYQQFIAQPRSISRSLQAHRRHQARQNTRKRINRGEIISIANQQLRENRHIKTA